MFASGGIRQVVDWVWQMHEAAGWSVDDKPAKDYIKDRLREQWELDKGGSTNTFYITRLGLAGYPRMNFKVLQYISPKARPSQAQDRAGTWIQIIEQCSG